MPHHHRKTCNTCARHEREVGPISGTGRCAGCGDAALIENHRQLMEHRGPRFQHWRRRTAAAVGAVLQEESTA